MIFGNKFISKFLSEAAENPRLRQNYDLRTSSGSYGCIVPAGTWHTVEVLEPSVIYEAKDGKYGEDGSEAV